MHNFEFTTNPFYSSVYTIAIFIFLGSLALNHYVANEKVTNNIIKSERDGGEGFKAF